MHAVAVNNVNTALTANVYDSVQMFYSVLFREDQLRFVGKVNKQLLKAETSSLCSTTEMNGRTDEWTIDEELTKANEN